MSDNQPTYQQENINIADPIAGKANAASNLTTINLTHDWFAEHTFYKPRAGIEVTPLVCGEEAFAAIYDAINKATSSVDIIIWGFDPSMEFKPNATGEKIGELLERKGKAGVNVKLLIWKNGLTAPFEDTLPGDGYSGKGGSTKPAKDYTQDLAKLDELKKEKEYRLWYLSYTRDQGQKIITKQQIQELDAQIAELEAKTQGYGKYSDSGAPKQSPELQAYTRDWFKRVNTGNMPNVLFATRDFTTSDRLQIDRITAKLGVGFTMGMALSKAASHHQKVVLIDYEIPQNAVGFVMGHNMHRHYWDTKDHYFYDDDANRASGFGPWQDISSKVRGPILYDINHNFVTAWGRAHNSTQLYLDRQDIKSSDFPTYGKLTAQFCRTQPQDILRDPKTGKGETDTSILKVYLKALGNTHNYVYMENQYFRYQPFAELLIQRAQELRDARKDQSTASDDENIYLFVLTNTPKSQSASETTYQMMDTLGQQQLMPEAQRTKQQAREDIIASGGYVSVAPDELSEQDQQRIKKIQTQQDIQKMTTIGEGYDIDGKEGEKPFELQELPGLKVVIGVLTSDSSIQKADHSLRINRQVNNPATRHNYVEYRDIYIHSKLLIVDDLLTVIASANINTRSMWTDSESGIAIPDNALAHKLRSELWNLHAKKSIDSSSNNASNATKCDAKENYKHWSFVMDANWKHKAKYEPLECHITRFWDDQSPNFMAID